MKQNIDISQLNELSEKGKEKLRKWWRPKEGDLVGYKPHGRAWYTEVYASYDYDGMEAWTIRPEKELTALPLLSIGQMLEILLESVRDRRYRRSQPIDFYQEQYCLRDWEEQWWRLVPEQLCDDLWSEVKLFLEKDD